MSAEAARRRHSTSLGICRGFRPLGSANSSIQDQGWRQCARAGLTRPGGLGGLAGFAGFAGCFIGEQPQQPCRDVEELRPGTAGAKDEVAELHRRRRDVEKIRGFVPALCDKGRKEAAGKPVSGLA